MSIQLFIGARIFDGARLHKDAGLLVEDGMVVSIMPVEAAPEEAMPIELDGGVIAPGLIDLQVNGGGGVLLNDRPDLVGIRTICEAHARLGSTGILPTLITDTPEVTLAAIEAGLAAARAGVPGFLGLHLEGPHLDARRHGAHDPALIRPMEDADLQLLTDAARRLPDLMVTLAPESVSRAQIASLVGAGAVVSIGHSNTGMTEARAAFRAGARSVTHLFNAMSGLGHREPGLVGAALDSEAVYCGLIADGVHVLPEVLRVALAAKRGADRMFLVSDAMAVAGTDLTEFSLRGRRILRHEGRLTLTDGTLAGADCDLVGCVRLLVNEVGVPLETALAMASSVPAACIGRSRQRGCLLPGVAADFVHLGYDLGLERVWRDGVPMSMSRPGTAAATR